MPTDLLAPLAGLALLDSTSFGTLLIPLWLMLAPGRLRPQRVLLYLATVGCYYLVLGIALLAGATTLADTLADFLATPTAAWLQLALGVGLFALSFRIGRRPPDDGTAAGGQPAAGVRATAGPVGGTTGGVDGSPARPTTAPTTTAPTTTTTTAAAPPSGRVARWRARATGAEGAGSIAALMGLALAAAAIETASMVPYLSAIGMLTASGTPLPSGAAVLAGYCLVMVLPALAVLIVRLVAHRWVRGPLERLEAWLSRSAAGMTAWIVGIVGFLLARDALTRTGILELLDRV